MCKTFEYALYGGGYIFAGNGCHSLDSRCVRDSRAILVTLVKCILTKQEAGGLEDANIGDSVEEILGSSIIAHGIEVSLIICYQLLVVNDRSAVTGTIIYMPLNCYPAWLQDDCKVMNYCPFRNIVV